MRPFRELSGLQPAQLLLIVRLDAEPAREIAPGLVLDAEAVRQLQDLDERRHRPPFYAVHLLTVERFPWVPAKVYKCLDTPENVCIMAVNVPRIAVH